MTRRRRSLAIVAGAALCIAAYVSASYLLSPAVQDSGGGHAESSSYQLDSSIGGPVIATGGTASSASYKLEVNAAGMLAQGAPGGPAPDGGGGGGCVVGSSSQAWLLPLALLALARTTLRSSFAT